MNPSEKLIIMALIYLVSGQEAHNVPAFLKNMLGPGNDQSRKTHLLNMLEARMMELDNCEQFIRASWKGENHESAV